MSLVKHASVLAERNPGRPGQAKLVDRVLHQGRQGREMVAHSHAERMIGAERKDREHRDRGGQRVDDRDDPRD